MSKVGRFPVKATGELETVVSKVVSYEAATDLKATWRSTALYLADNYLKPFLGSVVCAGGCADGGGNFAAFSDTVWALNPNRTVPWPDAAVLNSLIDSPDAQSARLQRMVARCRAGAEDAQKRLLWGLQDGALVVYNGHANIFNMGELEKAGVAPVFYAGPE